MSTTASLLISYSKGGGTMRDLVSYPIPGKSVILQFGPSALSVFLNEAGANSQPPYGLLIGSLLEGEQRWITITGVDPGAIGRDPVAGPPAIGYYSIQTRDAALRFRCLDLMERSRAKLYVILEITPKSEETVFANVYLPDPSTGFRDAPDYRIALPSEVALIPWAIPRDFQVPISPAPAAHGFRLPTGFRQLGALGLIMGGMLFVYFQSGARPGHELKLNSSSPHRIRDEFESEQHPSGQPVNQLIDAEDQVASRKTPFVRPAKPFVAPSKPNSSSLLVPQQDLPLPVIALATPATPLDAAFTIHVDAPGPPPPPASPISSFTDHQALLSPKTTAEPVTQIEAPVFVGPKVIRRVTPEMPPSAVALLTMEAQVDVTVRIDASGKVMNARVSAVRGGAAGLFAAASLRAAKLTQFQAAQENKRNVESTMILTFRFLPSRR